METFNTNYMYIHEIYFILNLYEQATTFGEIRITRFIFKQ